MAAAAAADEPTIIQWLFDTRDWFPEATTTRQLETHPIASRILALLPPSERAAALRYIHIRDAKMSLASSWLKHLAIAHLLPTLPWHASVITRAPSTGKPIFQPPHTPSSSSSPSPSISLNVTHQAGLVALIASSSPDSIDLGTDLVCTSERRARDHTLISSDTFPKFIDMHADVFSPRETSYLKYQILSAVPGLAGGENNLVDAKLRAFYALWALREAYVKMTGEALLAPWLRDLEFRGFRPVAPTPAWGVPAVETTSDKENDGRSYGPQVLRDFEIWFRGERVDDVNVCLRALGPDYMIATAVRTPADKQVGLRLKLGPYRELDLFEMLEFAEARMEESTLSWPSE
ncbi:hypothetical protein QBC47DRAFT_375531 [Echria macrotheca]|uniref:holo-[acyl-carrier-protein] synthase n=1 Tax=Echria macrotheca TaxID=438768 RepID=A0AAJ0BKB0_9PEZI|nr:hypothetical protein QBC47DRAFT_375531 [Echria macrotheca]